MPSFRVPPVLGLTERLNQPDGPLGAMVHTTAMRMVEEAIVLLRKAARLDPMLSGKVSDALAPLGAALPDDDDQEDTGEPTRPRGLQSPSRNY